MPAGGLDLPSLPRVGRNRASKRIREVRATSVSVKRLPKREIEAARALAGPAANRRHLPLTRGECIDGPRPCPFVSCPHHLYLDVNPRAGSIKLNFPDIEPDEMGVSCALDVADAGGATLDQVGAFLNLTRERIRQVEVKALGRAGKEADRRELGEFIDAEGLPVAMQKADELRERLAGSRRASDGRRRLQRGRAW